MPLKKLNSFIRKQPRWRVVTAGVVLILLFWWTLGHRSGTTGEITFAAKRGNLDITVIEGGSIEALASQEIRSEIRGGQGTKILKIVEEGYQVTEDDVRTGKVLVELDNADLKTRLTQQEIQFQSALASLTEAIQGYEIQRNQNVSNVKAAEQKAQFARMDLEKFFGDKTGGEIIRVARLDKLEAAAMKVVQGDDEQQMLSAMEINESSLDETADEPAKGDDNHKQTGLTNAVLKVKAEKPAPVIDFSQYAKAELLGDGSAMQQLRKFLDDLQSAKQQQSLSSTKLAGTKRLFEKGFSTKTEVDTDEISFQNNDLRVKTADTAYNLFIKYEFPKQGQELLSKYEESLRSLEREKKEAISKLAQAKARLNGAQSRYGIESLQRKELTEQLDKCIIKAEKPGLVVYGGGSSDNYYGNNEQIREGVTVRERQPIITIPDMTQMAVKVKVHESYIQKVKKGLRAMIQADAFPERKLKGEVTKVSILPDSQNRWMNPDLKVYQTVVTVEGAFEWLKPGMSAKVEIMVKQLKSAIYVPLQAITQRGGKSICHVVNGSTEMREVETGEFNDEFVEIKKGLEAGEKVLLRPPQAPKATETDKQDEEKSPTPEPTPAATPTPTPKPKTKS